jgi:peroxiredoxin Q/BCP
MTTGAQPQAGDSAPDFELTAYDGSSIRLEDFRGRPVVLYFYPKDDTPGCTVEACEFTAAKPHYDETDAVVIGVSPDSVESHQKFRDKHGLDVILASDPDHRAAETYGVWVEKQRGGATRWGVQRATFLIGPDGVIAKTWPKVKAEGHALEVLEQLRG